MLDSVRLIFIIKSMESAGDEVLDLDELSVTELKVLLREQHAQILTQREQIFSQDEQILSKAIEIEALKLQLLKLRRLQFGNRSEKREREIEQLELWVEELETADAQCITAVGSTPAAAV